VHRTRLICALHAIKRSASRDEKIICATAELIANKKRLERRMIRQDHAPFFFWILLERDRTQNRHPLFLIAL
jgi:hypothetical protein